MSRAEGGRGGSLVSLTRSFVNNNVKMSSLVITCFQNKTHCDRTCRRYVFVDDFPSKDHAVAWLFAWGQLDCASAADHISSDPSDDDLLMAFCMQWA